MALSAALACPVLHAADPDPRIAKEIEETLMRLADMGALDTVDPSRPLVIKQEARMRYELGAVVGVQRGEDESPVLAITPGGHAERMGLQVGDHVISINGVVLARSEDPGSDFARAISRSEGRVALVVRRGEETLALARVAEAVEVPGFRIEITQPLREFRALERTAVRRP